jgi:hypothetical protein
MSEFTETELKMINEFNEKVIASHNAHYEQSPSGLIDTSHEASPNGNLIYHFYSNGEITYQKGAWAYLKRSEFNKSYGILGAKYLPFKFVKEKGDGITYAILTKEECDSFAKEMKEICTIAKMN